MNFLNDFGVQPVFLIAQAVNFLILLFILKKFLYKPILKVLEERKQKISQGLKNAEEIEKKLEATAKDREEKLKAVSKDAEAILQEATKTAEKIVAEAELRTKKDVTRLMEKAEASMSLERSKIEEEMRKELVNLVAVALEKVTGKAVNEKDQKEILEKSIKDIKGK